MFALLSPGLIAVLLAMVSRRSLAGLTRQRIAWWPLGFASFGAEFAISSTPLGQQPFIVAWGSAIWLLALTAMVTMLARNAWLRSSAARFGWGVAALGVFINLVVVLANDGHMPQSQEARIAAGASTERVAGLTSDPGWRNVMSMTPQTRLAWLGDVLPEPAWLPLHNVMSLGDLLLAGGLAAVIYLATTADAEGARTQPRLAEHCRAGQAQRDCWTTSLMPGSNPSPRTPSSAACQPKLPAPTLAWASPSSGDCCWTC